MDVNEPKYFGPKGEVEILRHNNKFAKGDEKAYKKLYEAVKNSDNDIKSMLLNYAKIGEVDTIWAVSKDGRAPNHNDLKKKSAMGLAYDYMLILESCALRKKMLERGTVKNPKTRTAPNFEI